MDAYEERLIIEADELDKKYEKLKSFIAKNNWSGVDDQHKTLMIIQVSAMETYLKCLVAGLKLIDKK